VGIDSKFHSRPDYKRDILTLERIIHHMLGTLASFYRFRNKNGYTDDNKKAEFLFAELLSLVFDKKYKVSRKSNQKGFDIFTKDKSHAIQVSRRVDTEKVFSALTGTIDEVGFDHFDRISILVLKEEKPNLNDSVIKKKFHENKRLEDYERLNFTVNEDLLDFLWVSEICIQDSDKLEGIIEIFNKYSPYFDIENAKNFKEEDFIQFKENGESQTSSQTSNRNQSRTSVIEQLNLSTKSWEEYFIKFQEKFSPLNVVPIGLLNKIKRNGKSLFQSRHRGIYYVKDESFINEIQENSFQGNTLNNTLLSYGINKVKFFKNRKTYKIESKTIPSCPICSIYSFNLPINYQKGLHFNQDDPIKTAYVNYLLGDFENCVVALKVKSNEQTLVGYLSNLGLKRLRRVDYKLSESEGIYSLPSKDVFNKILENEDLSEEQVYVLRYINNRDYWDRQYSMIENIYKIESKTRLFTIDQKTQLHDTLIATWEDVYNIIRFGSHNYLIYDLEYGNINQLCSVVLNMILRISDKYNLVDELNINLDNLRNFLIHLRPSELSTVINKHNASTIFKPKIFLNSFTNQVANLESFLRILPEERYNIPIWNYIQNYLSNVLLIAEFCKNLDQIINKLLDRYFELIKFDEQLKKYLDRELLNFIKSQKDIVNAQIIITLKSIYFDSPKFDNIDIDYLDEDIDFETLNIIEFDRIKSKLSQAEREIYEDNVKDNLSKKFSLRYFRNAVVMECVKYENYQKQAYKELSKQIIEFQKGELFSSDHAKFQIINFVESMYYSNEVLSKEQINKLKIEDEYYKWLLNPVEWNYDSFNIYFITRNHSRLVWKKVVRIPHIKKLIENFLAKRNDENLSRIYFEYSI